MPTTNGWLRPDLQQMWATPLVAREYSLLLLLVAVAAIAAVSTFGLDVSKLYQSIVDVYP
jgi:hypothetical protein